MIVAPSVLSLDYADTGSQIKELNASEARWLHFDVMDGHFVPNLSFGPHILQCFTKVSDLVKDVHLMVTDPSSLCEAFITAGAGVVTFHYEAMADNNQIFELAGRIKEKVKVGLAVKPGTDLSVLKPFLHDFDMFLIMSVEPGFGGQAFMKEAVPRIRQLKEWLLEENAPALIEVDGGIDEITGASCLAAGADVLVAGSYIFKNDIKEAVASLCAKQ